MAATTRLPVIVVGGTDAADQAAVAMAMACDLPSAVVVRHELDVERGVTRRVISDQTGVLESSDDPLEHPCLSCALREDLVPTVLRVAGLGRWEQAIVVLPPTSSLLTVATALGSDAVSHAVPRAVSLRSVLAVVSGATVVHDILGDDTLAERGLDMAPHDPRTVGEVVSGHVEIADTVVVTGEADEIALSLLDHLRRRDSEVVIGTEGIVAADVLAREHCIARSRAAVDPRTREVPQVEVHDDLGLATVVLESWKPFHPARLHASFDELAGGPTRTRGCFWLPTRPQDALVWEDAGGQLALGLLGPWGSHERRTRLVLTSDVETIGEVREAFERALMTDLEMVGSADRWAGQPDGFDEWLGAADAA